MSPVQRTGPDGRSRRDDPVDLLLTCHLVLNQEAAAPLRVHLRYDVAEPLGVTLSFTADGDRRTRWVLARDLLQEGLYQPSGDGDVRVWPSGGCRCGCSGSIHARILLQSATGYALLDLPLEPVQHWLDRTWNLVPDGSEESRLDWSAVDRLTRPGPTG
ncbi:SsgA family sporulation/cell division regulator [Streptomyces sp. UH6]|uniref:SsgA family sporulation/cell division regulator n=1 Tax=Streptomyces sp. UH6 TaxID=2748379 RepID=UPI0015D4FEC3|nr:SsgA family sporulation/cell division regulator [Streptomyces sp. UH6]NYV75546.1 SsgA family sporulation/cell division regulator [Streptomyces sp. UH6]